MPNQIDAAGLQTKTQSELINEFTLAFQTIYGADINLDQDTPDGQMMMTFIQATLDTLDLLVQIYNMFDPDNAIGTVLDQRVAINGIQRQAGTFTTTNVTVTISQSVTLFGLDQTIEPVFTVADEAGNQWQLITTVSLIAPSATPILFQSAVPGEVLTTPNTITVPVTIVLGVDSVNNPTTYTTLGINEESDQELKIRRQRSVSLASQGYLAGLLAALENITGVESAFVYENNTGLTDANGVPGHSIWVIVSGTGANADIANAIYTKRNAGAGMFGSQSYVITQADGTSFTVLWDVVQPETLYIRFTATSLDGVNVPRIDDIKAGLVESFVPGVNAQVNINDLATAVQEIDNNCLVTDAGFSVVGPTGPFTNTLSPSAKNKQFAITAPNIIVTPIIISPSSTAVLNGGTKQFSAAGGFGTLTYSMFVNASGGNVVPGTGLYTAGGVDGTDTVRVTDSLGNFADATVVVT